MNTTGSGDSTRSSAVFFSAEIRTARSQVSPSVMPGSVTLRGFRGRAAGRDSGPRAQAVLQDRECRFELGLNQTVDLSTPSVFTSVSFICRVPGRGGGIGLVDSEVFESQYSRARTAPYSLILPDVARSPSSDSAS